MWTRAVANVIFLVCVGLDAQQRLVFDVASVKPNHAGPGAGRSLNEQGNVLAITNMTARDLVARAFQTQTFQIVGGPDWVADERFDITAKAADTIPPTDFDQVPLSTLMLRSLLEDRFRLVVHRDSREMPAYALVTARTDGQPGAGLRRSSNDCVALANAAGGRGIPPAPDGRPRCGLSGRAGMIMAGGYPMSQLVRYLSPQVERVVIDRTGLTGGWDFDLTFTSPQLAPTDNSPIDATASLFTALQEQLGLKLEPTRASVEVFVIDRVERPMPD